MSNVKRGAEANYNTMTNQDLLSLPIKEIADPDGAILALWVPSSLLPLGLELMRKYGFEFKQTYIWVKVKKEPLSLLNDDFKDLIKQTITEINKSGIKHSVKNIINKFDINNVLSFYMGRLFRQTHEVALIGINNKNIYKKLQNKSQRSVSFEENLKHSVKPEHLQDALELMFAGQKTEIFARRKRSGWICLGNEVCNGEDIRVSLKNIANE